MKNITRDFINHLGYYGFKGAVVPIHRVKDLQLQMNEMRRANNLSKDFYKRYLSRINFQIPNSIPETGSMLIGV